MCVDHCLRFCCALTSATRFVESHANASTSGEHWKQLPRRCDFFIFDVVFQNTA
jgi:hypothetical protein